MKHRQPACDHTQLNETIAEHRKREQRFQTGIEALLRPHHPYPDAEPLRPGNSSEKVGFYCERCRTPWPCRVFNDLRALYGDVTGWEPAKQPYERLVLHLAKDSEPEPTTGVPGSPATVSSDPENS